MRFSSGWRRATWLGAAAALGAVVVVSVPGHATGSSPRLQVGFGGAFSQGNTYTSATGEVLDGALTRRTGSEVLNAGLQLAGGTQGASFQPATGALTGSTVDRSLLLEATYIPTAGATQTSLTTVLAAAGYIFVRYSDATHLEFGYWAGSTEGTKRVIVNAPAAGSAHTVGLAYQRTASGTTMRAFLDGAEVGGASSTAAAVRNTGAAAEVGIGNDVHPSALARGLKGKITTAAYSTYSGAIPATDLPKSSRQNLKSGFTGSFSANAYTAASGDVVAGTLSRRAGTETIGTAGLTLAGGAQGLSFQPSSGAFTGSTIDTNLVLEAKYTRATTPTPATLETLLSAGGNMFVRYSDATHLEFGFSDPSGVKTRVVVNAPTSGVEHSVALAYERTASGAVVRAFVDGVAVGTATSTTGGALRNSTAANVGVGNEVHPSGLNRGFVGKIRQATYTTFTGPFAGSLLVNTTPCVTDTSTVQPARQIAVLYNECLDSLVAKASKVRPDDRQYTWHRSEQVAFVHFGVNTFTDLEWGYGDEDPDLFNPTALDTDQWAKALKDSGFGMAILTVKHHDGFALYDSRYTAHDVGSSAWESGNGDVMRRFADSMRKYGLKVGIYVSPADENAYSDGTGIFANGSARSNRTIPTLVSGDDRAGTNPRSFTLPATDYGAYMLNQLYELLTEYGQIDEVWFDGANGRIPAGSVETYDFDSWYSLIRSLAPTAVIANAGPDARWVGNESGVARQNEWSVLPTAGGVRNGTTEPSNATDQGSRAVLATAGTRAKFLSWYPAETDTSIRPGWFYHASQDTQVKSVATLTKIYHESVGRNSVLLLNIPPDKTGKIPAVDVTRLADWRANILRLYPANLATGKTATATAGTTPGGAIDASYDTAWKTTNGQPATLTVDLGASTQVDGVVIAEEIRQGQQVDTFTVEYQNSSGTWVKVPTTEQTLSIGAKRILPLSSVVTAQKFRLSITQARGPINIATFALYKAGA
ncbi:MAG TPA: alpha-L-fucosidase [Actinokineospora sp.]|nr:alpha-L-fucosidase [Actinokineospora sp.]